MEIKNSILAEHGFSAIVTITADGMPRSLLFDFGFSEHGAAYNADALDLDLTAVEAMVLSHGHSVGMVTLVLGQDRLPATVAFSEPANGGL
ncbi:MAG: hypothetical protein V2I56_13755 [Desulfobacteraceae bacterium]|jgi:7,8-dihydropterin-6-yl-methyl-4-(beta-D-ribofuranosyl)aminobenzene 5'-phosphate synthase|nr:hypothetical protein [Desulfobacteraceae bacterium]